MAAPVTLPRVLEEIWTRAFPAREAAATNEAWRELSVRPQRVTALGDDVLAEVGPTARRRLPMPANRRP